MIDHIARAAVLTMFLSGLTPGQEPGVGSPPVESKSLVRQEEASGRQVLVELYTSQGCNYCPTAEKLLQEMATRGYGTDRVVTLAFHVDYFNTPWADPFSDPAYSRRQWAFHQAFKSRNSNAPDLYFTPMVMVDGRYPMSGYHSDGTAPLWPLLKARLDRALRARRQVGMTLAIESNADTPSHRDLTIRLRHRSARPIGKDLLLCVAITEGPLSTTVPSGENAGATLIENHVVRRFLHEGVNLSRDSPTEATFSLDLGDGWDPSKCDLVAFLQDPKTGTINQVAIVPWVAPNRSGPRPE